MAITLGQVQTWNVTERGIGCIVLEWRDTWNALACGLIRLGGKRQKEKPARICAKCRRALPRLESCETSEAGEQPAPAEDGEEPAK